MPGLCGSCMSQSMKSNPEAWKRPVQHHAQTSKATSYYTPAHAQQVSVGGAQGPGRIHWHAQVRGCAFDIRLGSALAPCLGLSRLWQLCGVMICLLCAMHLLAGFHVCIRASGAAFHPPPLQGVCWPHRPAAHCVHHGAARTRWRLVVRGGRCPRHGRAVSAVRGAVNACGKGVQ